MASCIWENKTEILNDIYISFNLNDPIIDYYENIHFYSILHFPILIIIKPKVARSCLFHSGIILQTILQTRLTRDVIATVYYSIFYIPDQNSQNDWIFTLKGIFPERSHRDASNEHSTTFIRWLFTKLDRGYRFYTPRSFKTSK